MSRAKLGTGGVNAGIRPRWSLYRDGHSHKRPKGSGASGPSRGRDTTIDNAR